MRHFTCVQDLGDLKQALNEAFEIKKDRFQFSELGKNKTLLMIFFNSSLRTRLSTQKAAMNLGMNTIVLDVHSTTTAPRRTGPPEPRAPDPAPGRTTGASARSTADRPAQPEPQPPPEPHRPKPHRRESAPPAPDRRAPGTPRTPCRRLR